MTKRIALVMLASFLTSIFAVGTASGVADATSVANILPGTVTCSPSGGVWNGVITFSPPLMSLGSANTETMTVKATLGSTTSPCIASTGIAVLGSIAGQMTFHIAGGANKCSTIFSGSPLIAPNPAKFKMTWTTPAGASPTNWVKPPNFVVTGAASFASLVITKGKVNGSFAPFATPKATLSNSNWPGASGAVSTGCTASTGLSSLTLGTSKGKW